MADYSAIFDALANDAGLIVLHGTDSNRYDALRLCISGDAVTGETRSYYGGDGTPISEWLGRDIMLTLCNGPRVIKLTKARDFIADVTPLISRVSAGHSIEWDGNNNRGRLSDDAQAAYEAISDAAESYDWDSDFHIWPAHQWISGDCPRSALAGELDRMRKDFDNALATDSDIKAAADELASLARADNVIFADDPADALRQMIRDAAEWAADEALGL